MKKFFFLFCLWITCIFPNENNTFSDLLSQMLHMFSACVQIETESHLEWPLSFIPTTSVCNGFFISEDGYVLTANADRIKRGEATLLYSYRVAECPARLVIAFDNGIALLKVDVDEKQPYLQLGDAANVQLGESVFCLSYDSEGDVSISMGVIAAVAAFDGVWVDQNLGRGGPVVANEKIIAVGDSDHRAIGISGQTIEAVKRAIEADIQQEQAL